MLCRVPQTGEAENRIRPPREESCLSRIDDAGIDDLLAGVGCPCRCLIINDLPKHESCVVVIDLDRIAISEMPLQDSCRQVVRDFFLHEAA